MSERLKMLDILKKAHARVSIINLYLAREGVHEHFAEEIEVPIKVWNNLGMERTEEER